MKHSILWLSILLLFAACNKQPAEPALSPPVSPVVWEQTNLKNPNWPVMALVSSGTNLFAGTSNRVYRSTNDGTSWTYAYLTSPTNLAATVFALALIDTNILAGTSYGLFRSTNNGNAWTAVNTGLTDTLIRALAVSGPIVFAGIDNPSTGGGGVFLSSDNGTSWRATGLTNTRVYSLAVSGTHLFAGSFADGVFVSTNNGISWTAVNAGLTSELVVALAVSGTHLFAGTWDRGVFLSTDNGTSWKGVNSGIGLPQLLVTLAALGTNLFATWKQPGIGTYSNGVRISTDNGTSWTAANTGLTGMEVNALAALGINVFAGNSDGVFKGTMQ